MLPRTEAKEFFRFRSIFPLFSATIFYRLRQTKRPSQCFGPSVLVDRFVFVRLTPMNFQRLTFYVCLLVSFSFSSSPSLAKPEFVEVVKRAGLLKAGGKLDTAGCTLCHLGAPPKLNPYGAQLKPLVDAAPGKNLTPEILKQVADLDADGDGATNRLEFEQDTLPGDAASKPKVIPVLLKPTPPSSAAPAEPERGTLAKLLLPKHGQHPVLVHFPLALFVLSFVFDFLGNRGRNRGLLGAGYYNLSAAAFFAPITVLTGFLAWQYNYGGISVLSLKQNSNLLIHLLLGLTTTLVLWIAWRLRHKLREEERLPASYLAIAFAVFLIVVITGHLGGTLAYPE